MFRLALACCLALPVFATACSHQDRQSTQVATAPVLPLDKVRLYESGVGYFERAGNLDGRGASLPVPSAHLDDAIKSLVVLSRNGSVEDITFDSRQSPAVARARAGLPPDVDAQVDLLALLNTLQGAEIEVSLGRERLRGRLVNAKVISPGEVGFIDRRPAVTTDEGDDKPALKPSKQLHLSLLDRDGTFRRVDLESLDGIRPLDPERRKRFAAALAAQESTVGPIATTMRLGAQVKGPVRLGYLAEAPIWRTTFRLVFSPDQKATLQGWALVHNDTDEDWERVNLELVNGRPDSFMFPLAAPRYERRGLQTPPDELSSIPQLLVTTPDALWGDFADTWGGLASGGSAGTGSGYGRGSGRGFGRRASRKPRIRSAKAEVSDLLNLGDLAKVAGATGEETETVFIYRAQNPLNLAAHRSALVPFLHESIEASPIVRFGSFSDEARHAIRVVNNTRKTLPPGPVSIFADGGFMGEALLERLKPGERQFAEIGDDPDTELERLDHNGESQGHLVVFRRDALEQHYKRTEQHELVFTNRSGHEREVHLVLDVGRNATVEGADGIDFDSTTNQPLAIFRVPPGKGQPRKLVVTRGLRMRTSVSQVNVELLESYAEIPGLPQATKTTLAQAIVVARARYQAQEQVAELQREHETVTGDLERLREHLKALSDGERGASKPLLTRLLATEDRLQQVRKQQAEADRAEAAQLEKLRSELEKLSPATPGAGATP